MSHSKSGFVVGARVMVVLNPEAEDFTFYGAKGTVKEIPSDSVFLVIDLDDARGHVSPRANGCFLFAPNELTRIFSDKPVETLENTILKQREELRKLNKVVKRQKKALECVYEQSNVEPENNHVHREEFLNWSNNERLMFTGAGIPRGHGWQINDPVLEALGVAMQDVITAWIRSNHDSEASTGDSGTSKE